MNFIFIVVVVFFSFKNGFCSSSTKPMNLALKKLSTIKKFSFFLPI